MTLNYGRRKDVFVSQVNHARNMNKSRHEKIFNINHTCMVTMVQLPLQNKYRVDYTIKNFSNRNEH